MVNHHEAVPHEVAVAVKGAADQICLNATVNITGVLLDIGRADSLDIRRYVMCWHLTRVLGPSLAEKVPPAVLRKVVGMNGEARLHSRATLDEPKRYDFDGFLGNKRRSSSDP